MKFGSDDDSILQQLLHQLDLPAALYRLERVGFKLIAAHTKYHLRRLCESRIEDLFIELNSDGHFVIQHASNGQLPAYSDVITTWDEWVTFVRLLVLRSSLNKRPRDIEEPERARSD